MNPALAVSIGTAVGDFAAKQSWYRKRANTVNSFLGALVAGLLALSANFATTGRVDKFSVVTGVVAAFGSALFTRLTKNGLSTTNAAEITASVTERVSAEIEETGRHALEEVEKAAANAAPTIQLSLDALRERLANQ